MDERLEEAREYLEDGAPDEALAVLGGIDIRDLGAEDQREFHYLTTEARLELGDVDAARNALNEALSEGDDPGLRCLEALVLLADGDSNNALQSAERAVHLESEYAAGHYTRGVVLTFLDRVSDADRAFARAAELDPEAYFEPYRLSRTDFDKAVEEALASLPEEFRRHLENVEVAVENVPSPDLLESEATHDLLGLYRGGTIHSEEWDFPDQILLFQRNIENVSPDRKTLLREIRDTFLHEVGHHLGLDEDRLRAIEDEWEED